jgi:thiol-disulfide isomerase/thioredoxin
MASSFSVSLFALMLLSSCSNDPRDQVDDLAVAKMPKDQVQSTNYLPLNEDKPGTPARVQRYLAAGKYNIVMYYSPYDGPSMSYAPRMMQLPQVNQNIAVRTVNINRPEIQGVDLESQIAVDMQLRTLPYFVIFDPRGNMRAKGRAAFEQVNQFMRELPN